MKNKSLLKNTDEELMGAYKLGNLAAFEILYSRYSGKVYGYIYSKVNNQEVADDNLQQVFFKLHNKRASNKNKFLFSNWIFSITKNTLIDYYRKTSTEKTKREQLATQPAESTQVTSTPLSGDTSFIDHYKNMGLTEKQIQILKLKFESDLNNEEIAKIVSTSTTNIRQILSRSIRKIKDALKNTKEIRHEHK